MLLLAGSACAELSIHMLDVGQGDALLILCDGRSLLVDAGPEETGTFVHNYVSQRITDNQLNYVIATHGHADHLGGMTEALRGFSIGQIYTPAAIPMSYWLNHILPKTKGGSFTVNKPQPKETFTLGTATIQFLNVLTEAEIENDLSLVIRIDYENTSVLLTGDLEGAGQISLLEAGADLKADVLKVGHHGENTSTSDAFLKSVHPRYALISVGKGNKHGHPHQEVLTRLAKNSITVYRIDQFGTIIMTSDGQDWKAEVMLTQGNRVLIIDAKYYASTTQQRYDARTVHSHNLYQIFTYVKNKEAELAGQPDREVSGMLLYARTDEKIQPDYTYHMSGNRISVKTLDLNCDFKEIREQLNELISHL